MSEQKTMPDQSKFGNATKAYLQPPLDFLESESNLSDAKLEALAAILGQLIGIRQSMRIVANLVEVKVSPQRANDPYFLDKYLDRLDKMVIQLQALTATK